MTSLFIAVNHEGARKKLSDVLQDVELNLIFGRQYGRVVSNVPSSRQ